MERVRNAQIAAGTASLGRLTGRENSLSEMMAALRVVPDKAPNE
jgi:hypothetical protein